MTTPWRRHSQQGDRAHRSGSSANVAARSSHQRAREDPTWIAGSRSRPNTRKRNAGSYSNQRTQRQRAPLAISNLQTVADEQNTGREGRVGRRPPPDVPTRRSGRIRLLEPAKFVVGVPRGFHEDHRSLLRAEIKPAVRVGQRPLSGRQARPLHLAGRQIEARENSGIAGPKTKPLTITMSP